MPTEALHALRDRPFDLLLGLEEAVLGRGVGGRRAGEDLWVGVAFRLGSYRLICSRTEIREVIPWPGVTRVPRAQSWLMGLANVRGQLLPVTDVGQWAGLGETQRSRSSRVIVVNHPEIPAGLLVDQVVGFRRFTPQEAGERAEELPETLKPFLLGTYGREGVTWSVLGLRDLVESEAFLQAAS